jgi:hypothetical protein
MHQMVKMIVAVDPLLNVRMPYILRHSLMMMTMMMMTRAAVVSVCLEVKTIKRKMMMMVGDLI